MIPPMAWVALALALAQEPLALDDLPRLLDQIKPPAEESPWRRIPWLTSIREARARAVAEEKPIVVFTAADGSPLGRT
jgi:hypothetical protein